MHKYLVPLILTLFVSGCSTHMSKVEYEGDGSGIAQAKPVIGEVIVSDKRGIESDWLGAIRGGYGNRLKTLRTEQSTDKIVDDMYTSALQKAGLLDKTAEAPYRLIVDITKFDCSYFFNREAHAHVNISLRQQPDSPVSFSKTYKTDLTERGVGAGIFGDVETLRDFAEEAMNETIDKMLNDSEFADALKAQRVSIQPSKVERRLRELDALKDQGLITDIEYERKRNAIISDL